MANPNIVNVTDIVANNAFVKLTTTNITVLASNPPGSNKVYKINTVIVANIDGLVPRDITVSVFSEENLGGTETQVIDAIAIPAGASLIAVDKATTIYLTEDQSLGAKGSSADAFTVVASWEEIS